MNKIFVLLIFTIISVIPANAAKRIEANPINIGAVLINQPDSATIASYLEYYGYSHTTNSDSYTVFTHPNGSSIRFTYYENGTRTSTPTIIVKSKTDKRIIHNILTDLNFQKTEDGYVQGKRNTGAFISPFSNMITIAKITSDNSIILKNRILETHKNGI